MKITLPYSTENTVYGTTFSSTYQWYVQWYQYPTNTSNITSQAGITINSFTRNGNNIDISLTISSINVITRAGTSGYTCSTFTYQTQPTILLYNSELGTSVNVYNGALTTTVAASGDGSTTSGSIVHNSTVTVSVPKDWFKTGNRNWYFTISDVLTITSTGATQTNTKTFATFEVPSLLPDISILRNGTPVLAENVWTMVDGVIYEAEKIAIMMDGTVRDG